MSESLENIFRLVAPSYQPENILAHFKRKFSHLSEGEFVTQVSECLKFLYLRSYYGKGFIPLSEDVDEIWHAFILQTREYADFCQSLPGKEFIHHNSISAEDDAHNVGNEVFVRELIGWIPNYTKHFGPFTENTAHYWMIINVLRNKFGLSLDQINHLS